MKEAEVAIQEITQIKFLLNKLETLFFINLLTTRP